MSIHGLSRATKRRSNESFRWAVGIEGSCIPHLNVDQYQWTQHDRYWRRDFKLVASDLGCRWMRYTLPWHLIEKRPGHFDWKWADQRIGFARELGINLIIDLVHFGTPTWLPEAFGDIDFPSALERFAERFGERYSGQIASVCPINEPLITSLFCGDIGLWPPHGRSLMNYTAVLSRVTLALHKAIKVLRKTMKGVEIIICDALEVAKVNESFDETTNPYLRESLRVDVTRRMWRRHIVLDLLMGHVDHEHHLYPWLTENGFSKMDLNWFLRNPVSPDVVGLDYYPHTEVELFTTPEGQCRQRVPEELTGLYTAALDYWNRYHLPLMITETSYNGSDKERREWLEFTVAGVRQLRKDGIPVVGYTWWPLVDHLDWDGALLHRIGHIHPVGIYRLERLTDGRLQRKDTPLRDAYRDLIQKGDEAVGPLPTFYTRPPRAQTKAGKELARRPKDLSYSIIVHCHLRWDGVWQRPQQFLSRLSQRHRILFVEGPTLTESDQAPPRYLLRDASNHPNITVMSTEVPAARFNDGEWVDAQRYRLLREALEGPLTGQFDNLLQWFYDPMAATAFVGKMNELAIVYDCMDELSQFKFAPPEIIHRERALLERADVVFTGGRKLYLSKSRFNNNCHFYGCGVDVDHFSKARIGQTVVPPDVSFVPKPVLGYFGVVDERLDYDLIAKLADANQHWSVVLIGPVAKVDPASLPRRPHLYWLGRREYAQLPAYAKGFDLCLMPFARNEATEFINPTKALEYMATGKQIVSSAVPDVVTNFGDVVKIAESHDAFIDLCRSAVTEPDEAAVERGLKMARDNQWEAIVGKLEQHIQDVLNARSLRHGATGERVRQKEVYLSEESAAGSRPADM